jgi:hypothetical protein
MLGPDSLVFELQFIAPSYQVLHPPAGYFSL